MEWLVCMPSGIGDCAGSGVQSHPPLPCTDRSQVTLLQCLICPTWLGGCPVDSAGTPFRRWRGGVGA